MFKGKIKKLIFKRSVIVGALIFIQFLFMSFLILSLAKSFIFIYIFLNILSIATVLYIAGKTKNPAYKHAWTTLILVIPLFGGIFYLFFGNKKMKYKKERLLAENAPYKNEDDTLILSQINYLSRFTPLYTVENEDGFSYYKTGEECFSDMIAELRKAKEFIFIEYFIIADGIMWDAIYNILKEKASFGVDVRIIYDDCGCLGLLPKKFNKLMKKNNIKCRAFNPLRPSLAVTMNNRDHRKIMVIDGKTAFSGGINIADEYINEIEKYGHWKDNGIKISGECVKSFTKMFLDMWSLIKEDNEDYSLFLKADKKEKSEKKEKNEGQKARIQVYCDNPFSDEKTGKNVYLNMITKAKKELYITTPYLILDNELTSALILSAKNGVKIRIVTPGIADKCYVHTQTRSSYLPLINEGIEIYEYTPGFIHSKVFVCDSKIATVGSVNLDYRSLYLHFECGIVMYRLHLIDQIEKDIKKTIKKSRKISASDCKRNIFVKIIRSILRIFAPLM